MKFLAGLLLVLSFTANANDEFEFDCVCKNSVYCKNLEDLTITIGDKKIEGVICNDDGEWCDGFKLKATKESVPSEFVNTYYRYAVSSSHKLPMYFDKSDILLKKSMLTGGTRKVGPAKTKFTGSVVVIDQEGATQLEYGCSRRIIKSDEGTDE